MITVHVRDNELAREWSAVSENDGIVVHITIGQPMLARKDRAALVSRARELTWSILDRLMADAPL